MRIVSIPVNLIGQAVILVIMYMFVSIPVNLIGQAVILVIMYMFVQTFTTDVIVFSFNVIMCLTSH
jgi:hypothetical protein